MFRRKEEKWSVKEFMNRHNQVEVIDSLSPYEVHTAKKAKTATVSFGLSLLPLAFAPLMQSTPAMAAESLPVLAPTDAMYDKMLHAFDPLIMLVQSLAYPVAMVVVLGGAIMVMINQSEKGFSMMQKAGLGYVLVQMTPLVLNILVDAMKAM
ncbi:hypothetical protein [Peribacillus acanthi]|uniref:hypothetical protein n=1 Tax=Peribacillus acanthi TaxID=2171554 RepID=UPI000D3E84C5|nr:hypothetical protein [Peribacillus acanthi]